MIAEHRCKNRGRDLGIPAKISRTYEKLIGRRDDFGS